MAQKVYITGHRNPDMDSVCSAYCYAAFKRLIDPQTEYIPIRCGHLNDSAKGVFDEIGVTPPAFMKDLRPRVGEVTNPPRDYLYLHDPVYSVVNILHGRTVSIVPIFHENGEYAGLISVDDVNGMFMKENSTGRPRYTFRVDNFSCVVEGYLLKRGKQQEFETFLMTGAMPYEVSLHRIRQLLPEKPVLVVGMRRDLVDYAVEQQLPAIILTGYTAEDEIDYDFSGYEGSVYVSYLDTAETIRLIRLSLPINNIIPRNIPQLQATDLFDDALTQLLESGYRGLPVFDNKEFMGTVTRRCFIKRPKKQVILVDHNEISQSVRGIEDSDVIEILDHHRLAAEKTRHPIYIFAAPLGSTCTLVYQHFQRYNIPIEYSIAILLLSGILSDTVILKSPTATEVDRDAVKHLSAIAKIDDFQQFGERIFSRTTNITEGDTRKLIESDFKRYEEYGCTFGIGQVEVVTLENVDEVKDRLLSELESVRREHGLDWAMLLITDVIKEGSVLLTTPFPTAERGLIYRKESEGKFDLPGTLSRKKQLLPEILRVLEERRTIV